MALSVLGYFAKIEMILTGKLRNMGFFVFKEKNLWFAESTGKSEHTGLCRISLRIQWYAKFPHAGIIEGAMAKIVRLVCM